MFFFNTKLVKQILPRAVKKLDTFQKINPHANEGVRLLTNAVIFFLKKGDNFEAVKYITAIEQYTLTEEQTFERILVKLFSSIKRMLLGENNQSEKFEECLRTMDFLEMKNIANMSRKLINQLDHT